MSPEDRLFALLQQIRAAEGDAALAAPDALVPRIAAQAPDLYGEARALAAALKIGAPARLAGAPDPAGEVARLGAEIAAAERLSMACVEPALAVVRRMGNTVPLPPPAPPPVAGGWAGDSVAVGAPVPPPPAYPGAPAYAPPAPPPPPPAATPTPVWQNKWALGAAGAVAVLVGLNTFGRQAQQPQQPPPQQPMGGGQGGGQGGGAPFGGGVPQGPGGGGQPGGGGAVPGQGGGGGMPMGGDPNGQDPGAAPMGPPSGPPAGGGGGGTGGTGGLATLQPPGGAIPTMAVRRGQDGTIALGFSVMTRGGAMPGVVLLPANGWDSGPTMVAFSRPGSEQPETLGGGQMQRGQGQGGPMRAVQPQWQQDGIGMGNICIAFSGGGQGGGQGGGDVPLQGSTMCVMDGACGRAAGCGRVP
jgi:hypothetical protein